MMGWPYRIAAITLVLAVGPVLLVSGERSDMAENTESEASVKGTQSAILGTETGDGLPSYHHSNTSTKALDAAANASVGIFKRIGFHNSTSLAINDTGSFDSIQGGSKNVTQEAVVYEKGLGALTYLIAFILIYLGFMVSCSLMFANKKHRMEMNDHKAMHIVLDFEDVV